MVWLDVKREETREPQKILEMTGYMMVPFTETERVGKKSKFLVEPSDLILPGTWSVTSQAWISTWTMHGT